MGKPKDMRTQRIQFVPAYTTREERDAYLDEYEPKRPGGGVFCRALGMYEDNGKYTIHWNGPDDSGEHIFRILGTEDYPLELMTYLDDLLKAGWIHPLEYIGGINNLTVLDRIRKARR